MINLLTIGLKEVMIIMRGINSKLIGRKERRLILNFDQRAQSFAKYRKEKIVALLSSVALGEKKFVFLKEQFLFPPNPNKSS